MSERFVRYLVSIETQEFVVFEGLSFKGKVARWLLRNVFGYVYWISVAQQTHRRHKKECLRYRRKLEYVMQHRFDIIINQSEDPTTLGSDNRFAHLSDAAFLELVDTTIVAEEMHP